MWKFSVFVIYAYCICASQAFFFNNRRTTTTTVAPTTTKKPDHKPLHIHHHYKWTPTTTTEEPWPWVPSTDHPSSWVPSTDHPSSWVHSTDHPSTWIPSTDHPSSWVPSTDHPAPWANEWVKPVEETPAPEPIEHLKWQQPYENWQWPASTSTTEEAHWIVPPTSEKPHGIHWPSTSTVGLPEPLYKFIYKVNSPGTRDIKTHEEESDGSLVRGHYSFVEPNGSTRVVYYTAGEDGFKADVQNYDWASKRTSSLSTDRNELTQAQTQAS